MLSHVWPKLLNDRYFRLLALPFLALGVILAWPNLSADELKVLVDNYVDPPIIGLCVLAFLAAGKKTQHAEERRFWDLLAVGFGIWLSVILLNLTWRVPGHTASTYLLSDSLYLVSYLAIFIAIESRPHRAPGWSKQDPSLRLESLGALTFICTVLVYTVLVPGRLYPSQLDSFVSPLAAFLSLDLLILGRALHFRATCRSVRWKSLFGWLAVGMVFCAFNDFVELVTYSVGSIVPRGGWYDFLWYMPWIAFLGLARAAVILPEDRTVATPKPTSPPIRTSLLPQCSLVVYSFLLPMLHFIWHGAGFLDPALREIRELITLVGLMILATLTIFQYLALDRQNRALRDRLAAAEENLNQARRMEAVGRLAGGVAHDFNNLLMVIRGYCEILQDESQSNSGKRATTNILNATDRAVALTKQLLAFSRKQVVVPRPLDLNNLVATVEGFLHRLMGNHIRIDLRPAAGLWAVCADPGQMEQVLMNLAANARDAMPQGGALTIRTSNVRLNAEAAARLGLASAGDFVCLRVEDNGVGMCAETRSRIFEPFYTTKERGKGTGLGMATVYAVIQQASGAIDVHTQPGAGAAFSIYLPRTLEPIVAATLPPVEAAATGSETILLVEDEVPVRHLARDFLAESGYSVLEAGSPSEALQLATRAANEIHLLVTDVIMPGMGGREMAEQLTSLRPAMKVLFISGHTDDTVMVHGVAQQGFEFLQKPFTRNSLLSRVRHVLNAN